MAYINPFSLTIDDLTIESNSTRLDKKSESKTNNIINSIMPFDTENCVKWDANYIKGYTSEKRDINIGELRPLVQEQCKDITRYTANSTLKYYDRGVRWDLEKLDIKGDQWTSAYLPVWLYSYLEKKNNKNLLHYVAVNARTKETMGSVPVHMPKLFFISAVVELLGIIATCILNMIFNLMDADERPWWPYLLLLLGFVYFGITYEKYRNKNARHYHEKETKSEIRDMKKVDNLIDHRKKIRESTIQGANNTMVNGRIGKSVMQNILNK